jgi:hypothetical protein
MAQQAVLDVLGAERFLQQGIVHEVDHPQGQIIAGLPVSVGAS